MLFNLLYSSLFNKIEFDPLHPILSNLFLATYKKMYTKITVLHTFKVKMYTKKGLLTYVAENR